LNPRPMACKATALATELYPQVRVSRLPFVSKREVEYEEREGQERTGLPGIGRAIRHSALRDFRRAPPFVVALASANCRLSLAPFAT
jgi:hypothetical protein